MKFVFKPEHLEIKLSFKERLNVLLHGYVKFNKKSAYVMAASLMRIITDIAQKYGDSKEHGELDLKDNIET